MDSEDEKHNNRLEYLLEMYFDTVYDEVELGGSAVDDDDIKEAIKYFSDKEEYEKCIVLKKSLEKEKVR
jgi:hypothetical protein